MALTMNMDISIQTHLGAGCGIMLQGVGGCIVLPWELQVN